MTLHYVIQNDIARDLDIGSAPAERAGQVAVSGLSFEQPLGGAG